MGRTSAAVSTESQLADKNGRQLAASVPQTGKVVVYKAGDTLVSKHSTLLQKNVLMGLSAAGAKHGDAILIDEFVRCEEAAEAE